MWKSEVIFEWFSCDNWAWVTSSPVRGGSWLGVTSVVVVKLEIPAVKATIISTAGYLVPWQVCFSYNIFPCQFANLLKNRFHQYPCFISVYLNQAFFYNTTWAEERGKCLPDLEFFPWVLSFLLEFWVLSWVLSFFPSIYLNLSIKISYFLINYTWNW